MKATPQELLGRVIERVWAYPANVITLNPKWLRATLRLTAFVCWFPVVVITLPYCIFLMFWEIYELMD